MRTHTQGGRITVPILRVLSWGGRCMAKDTPHVRPIRLQWTDRCCLGRRAGSVTFNLSDS